VVVDESGRVVAFHVASSSSAFTFEEATKVAAETKKQQMQQQPPQTTTKSGRISSKRAATGEVDVELIDSVSEAFKSHASSYAALSACIIVSFHPKLEKALVLKKAKKNLITQWLLKFPSLQVWNTRQ
jgi:hypothetical protein